MTMDRTIRRGPLTALRGADLAVVRGAPVVGTDARNAGVVAEVWIDDTDGPRVVGVDDGGPRTLSVDAAAVDVITGEAGCLVILHHEAWRLREMPAAPTDPGLFRAWEAEELVDELQTPPAPTPEIAAADDVDGSPDALRAGDPATRQATPSPTPEIALAELEDDLRHGRDPEAIRAHRAAS